jgi:hypothetical protein
MTDCGQSFFLKYPAWTFNEALLIVHGIHREKPVVFNGLCIIIVQNLISFSQWAIIIRVMTIRKQQKSLLELEKPAKL